MLISSGTARSHRSSSTIGIQSTRHLDHLSEVQVEAGLHQQASQSENLLQTTDPQVQQSLWWVKMEQLGRRGQERNGESEACLPGALGGDGDSTTKSHGNDHSNVNPAHADGGPLSRHCLPTDALQLQKTRTQLTHRSEMEGSVSLG